MNKIKKRGNCMRITAFAIGSEGDVAPFIALGKELKRRGHEFKIVTFLCFKSRIEKNGLLYGKFHGDPEEMMQKMLSESEEGPGTLQAIRELLRKYPQIYQDTYESCKKSDLIIYMQFGAIAYHFAEKFKIPCIRTFALPYDATKLYSPFFPGIKRNTFRCKISYKMCDIMMNWAAKEAVDKWRKKLELKRWSLLSSYKKMYKKPIVTLYQYSDIFVPRDTNWGKHIYITGEWNEEIEDTYEPDQKLLDFIQAGQPPIYIGFGSVVYSKLSKLQELILDALKKTGQRAILLSAWSKFEKKDTNPNIFYADYIPFTWLFRQVSAVVHHGGAGTISLALRAGKPTWVMGFGVDQVFRGTQAHELGVGPEPIQIGSKEMTLEVITERLQDLTKEQYEIKAKEVAKKLKKENGCIKACDIIEKIFIDKRERKSK
jgi:sterol 3beta-glucosyltransferase